MPLRASSVTPRNYAVPSDNGLLGWTFDPATAGSTLIATAGALQVVKVYIPAACTVTNLLLISATAGATLTSGQNFAALFSGTTRIGITADQTTAWQTAGVRTMALTTPAAVDAGVYSVAWYSNGTTQPTWRCAANSSVPGNTGLVTATARFGTADTGLTTTMPTTLGAMTSFGVSTWAGVS